MGDLATCKVFGFIEGGLEAYFNRKTGLFRYTVGLTGLSVVLVVKLILFCFFHRIKNRDSYFVLYHVEHRRMKIIKHCVFRVVGMEQPVDRELDAWKRWDSQLLRCRCLSEVTA